MLRPTREEGTRLRVFPLPEGIAGAGLAWPDCLRVFAPGGVELVMSPQLASCQVG